jgi:hypothetical protein
VREEKMKTPQRSTIEEFSDEAKRWAFTEAKSREDGIAICAKCESVLELKEAHVSIHFIELSECTGAGRVSKFFIPYCPRCEPVPDTYGCLHIPMPAPKLPQIDLSHVN